MNIISNEPSLGLYRIQEHIRKSIPKLENQTKKLEDCSTVMKDLNYTMENAQHSIISGIVLLTVLTYRPNHFKWVEKTLKNKIKNG